MKSKPRDAKTSSLCYRGLAKVEFYLNCVFFLTASTLDSKIIFWHDVSLQTHIWNKSGLPLTSSDGELHWTWMAEIMKKNYPNLESLWIWIPPLSDGTEAGWMGSCHRGVKDDIKRLGADSRTLFLASASSSLLLWSPREADWKTGGGIWDPYSLHLLIIPSFYVGCSFLCSLNKSRVPASLIALFPTA